MPATAASSSELRGLPFGWKRLAAGIPLAAVALLVYGSTDRADVAQARTESSVFQSVVGEMRRDLAGRAAISLTGGFDPTLSQWTGSGDAWQASWKMTGSEAFPGRLALYTPSIVLRDYTAEFTGELGKKALSFVVRARDLDNYYAVRLVVVTPGLMPEIALERYAVSAGEESEHVRTPIHFPVAHDTLYHVRTEIRDQNFTVYLNDKLIDSWTDARFPSGGVGFFAKKGEKARITGLHVWHQDDAVGRLLAHISTDDDKKSR